MKLKKLIKKAVYEKKKQMAKKGYEGDPEQFNSEHNVDIEDSTNEFKKQKKKFEQAKEKYGDAENKAIDEYLKSKTLGF